MGAFLFFPLIHSWEVTRSLVLLCAACFCLGLTILTPGRRVKLALWAALIAFLPFVLMRIPEIKSYTIDKNKGWEWIPGAYKPQQYQ
ncbi:MAG TPA: hypothetical protein PKU74_05345, partial [Candidatus Omnitrophota bacterium]|nr:hypothetical protein [Candidatus Omnitrophota bacterium]